MKEEEDDKNHGSADVSGFEELVETVAAEYQTSSVQSAQETYRIKGNDMTVR